EVDDRLWPAERDGRSCRGDRRNGRSQRDPDRCLPASGLPRTREYVTPVAVGERARNAVEAGLDQLIDRLGHGLTPSLSRISASACFACASVAATVPSSIARASAIV